MKARLAFLTSPQTGVYLFKYQEEGGDLVEVEISRAHLINVLIDGASHAFREQYPHRVPEIQPVSVEHEQERARL